MLARILPILALVLLAALGWFLYSEGIIQRIVRPTVSVIETRRQLIEGQRIRSDFITVREISINRVAPGMITFPANISADDVERTLASQTVSRNIPAGQFVLSSMLGKGAGVTILRVGRAVEAGDNLTVDNVGVDRLAGPPPGGAIIFDSEEAGIVYLNETFDLAASEDISENQVLTVSNTSGAANRVFVVRAARNYSGGSRLSIDGLEADEISGRDLPAGAITFQTRGATNVFITASNRYGLSGPVDRGEIITAGVLSVPGGEDTQPRPGRLPETLSELTSYMQAFPGKAMFLDSTNLIGKPVDPGETVDIWVETNRTQGAFGEIRMKRLVAGVLVREARDDTRDAPQPDSGEDVPSRGGTAQDGDDGDDDTIRFLWISTEPGMKRVYDAARRDGALSFAISDEMRMVDVLGNGSMCMSGVCQVNRNVSGDLESIASAIAVRKGSGDGSPDAPQPDPLVLMDGVSNELQERLRANGFESFEAIAAWEDAEIPAITIKLDISNNLAVYIRQQARILAGSAEEAAESLGFDEVPAE